MEPTAVSHTCVVIFQVSLWHTTYKLSLAGWRWELSSFYTGEWIHSLAEWASRPQTPSPLYTQVGQGNWLKCLSANSRSIDSILTHWRQTYQDWYIYFWQGRAYHPVNTEIIHPVFTCHSFLCLDLRLRCCAVGGDVSTDLQQWEWRVSVCFSW